jgi:hypothetical protein
MNIEAITKTIKLIERMPAERMYMRDFATGDTHVSATCETAACVGGWAVAANPPIHFYSYQQAMLESFQVTGHIAGSIIYMFDVSGNKKTFENLVRTVVPNVNTNNSILSIFDELPAEMRKRAMIIMLQELVVTGEVDWLGAVANAISEVRQATE